MPRFLALAEWRLYAGAERLAALARLPGGGEDTPALEAALAAAESEALSYLSTRYSDDVLPTSPGETVPAALRSHIASLATWALVRGRSDLVGEELRAAGVGAIAWLRDVAAGRASLGLSAAPAVDQAAPQILVTKGVECQVFGNGGLDSW